MGNVATIASGAALSGAIDLGLNGQAEIVGVVMPAAWTAAALTFQVSPDGTNYSDLYDDGGTEVNFTVAAARAFGWQQTTAHKIKGWRWLKIRSGTTGLPVNQAAQRLITVVTK